MSAICVVCGKTVGTTDQQEHLATNHLGPHYFWHDAKKYRTMKPSMSVAELKGLVDHPANYFFVQERCPLQPDLFLSDNNTVDLTREPHFFSTPPATF